jgi:hypothetical protein
MTYSSHAETGDFQDNIFQSSRHAETDDLDYDTFQPCCNRQFRSWRISDMLELTIFTMTHSSYSKTDNSIFLTQTFPDLQKLTILTMTYSSLNTCRNWLTYCDLYTFKPYWNGQFWQWHIPDKLELTILSMMFSSNLKTDKFEQNVRTVIAKSRLDSPNYISSLA